MLKGVNEDSDDEGAGMMGWLILGQMFVIVESFLCLKIIQDRKKMHVNHNRMKNENTFLTEMYFVEVYHHHPSVGTICSNRDIGTFIRPTYYPDLVFTMVLL